MTPLYRLSTYERSSSGTHACLWLASILVLWRRLSGGNHLKPSCRRSRFSMQLRIDAKVVRPSGRAITGQRNVPLSLFRRLPIRKESGGMRQQLSLLKDNFRRTCPTDPTQRTKPVLPVKHTASLKAENPQLLAELRVLLLVHPGGLEPPTH